jgi:mannitol/fructose-specific phosphotransferase system IIA component
MVAVAGDKLTQVLLHFDNIDQVAMPVEFGALDGKPVHVLFSLVSPTVRAHLRLLSRLSFSLHDPAFKKAITQQASRDEILEAARCVEEKLERAPLDRKTRTR